MNHQDQIAKKRNAALAAFERRDADCAPLLTDALVDSPSDGALILAEAAALAEAQAGDPFVRLRTVLAHDPAWVSGQRGLAQLAIEFGYPKPLGIIEAALAARPNDPKMWHCYLNLLAACGRHAEAADATAELRRRIGNVPALRLLEARYAGLAGDAQRASHLLDGLPNDVPDVDYQRARNALQRGDVEAAETLLDTSDMGDDMRLWAMRELCWRVLGDPRLNWLMQDGQLVAAYDLALSETEIGAICDYLRILHHSGLAPPSQSLRGGTQTRGQLHLRAEPDLAPLFDRIAAALSTYRGDLAGIESDHPLAALARRTPLIGNSWSVRLTQGGYHVPHIHDAGKLSSACHLTELGKEEGALELGRPPTDMALELEPIATFIPQPGRLILFPSFLYHSTAPFGVGERLTAVVDAH